MSGGTTAFDLAIFLALVLVTFFFIRNLGFVSDDYFLLVENLKLPLLQSVDELHRPLRNVLLRFMGTYLGLHQVWFYRLLVASNYVLVLALLFRFMLRLGAGRNGAWAAVLCLAVFPRNQEVLFWFAAWQDLAAGICILLACLFFLDYRESGRGRGLIFAGAAFVVALGFKETMAVIPAVLVLLDIYREKSLRVLKDRAMWRAYVPFAIILLLYAVYYLSDSGWASLTGHRTSGYYRFHGVSGVIAGVVRALINIALPFVTPVPLGLMDVRPRHIAMMSIEAVALLFLVWRLRAWSILVFGMGWMLATILPTAAFAAAFNADRYLFVPVIGAAAMVGLLIDTALASGSPRLPFIVAWTALAIYGVAGISYIAKFRQIWMSAGQECDEVVAVSVRAASGLPAGSEVDLVNVTHSLDPYVVSVFNNGLGSAILANGARTDIRFLANYNDPDPSQRTLNQQMQACLNASSKGDARRIVLFTHEHRLVPVDEACATPLIDADRAKRPKAWFSVGAYK